METEKKKWKCPITKKCTNSLTHRRCTGIERDPSVGGRCHGEDCWDCCNICKAFCEEPPLTEASQYASPDEGD